jgi:hypothetical protein
LKKGDVIDLCSDDESLNPRSAPAAAAASLRVAAKHDSFAMQPSIEAGQRAL